MPDPQEAVEVWERHPGASLAPVRRYRRREPEKTLLYIAEPTVSEAIALARATRAVANPVAAVDLEQIATDTKDSFYAALGRRLAQLQRATGEQAPALAHALVVQCVRFGPRQLDAAVLLEALRNGLRDDVRAVGLEDYSRRLEVDRDLRLLLTPIVDLFLGEGAQA